MKLYFLNSQNILKLISEPDTEDKALKDIKDYLDRYHFKSYYTRTWNDNKGYKWYDVGSWSEFFILTRENIEKDNISDKDIILGEDIY